MCFEDMARHYQAGNTGNAWSSLNSRGKICCVFSMHFIHTVSVVCFLRCNCSQEFAQCFQSTLDATTSPTQQVPLAMHRPLGTCLLGPLGLLSDNAYGSINSASSRWSSISYCHMFSLQQFVSWVAKWLLEYLYEYRPILSESAIAFDRLIVARACSFNRVLWLDSSSRLLNYST